MKMNNILFLQLKGIFMEIKRLGLYIHIPFCMRKCRYCDFLSFPNIDICIHHRYTQALKGEIEAYGETCGTEEALECADESQGLNHYEVDTIFIGGGTPSLLEHRLIGDILDGVRANFSVARDAEISIEANPKTLTEEKLKAYRHYGINRLSLGCQSMDSGILHFMGRVHEPEDFTDNFRLARRCDFDNINVDLMFGIKGQTMDSWKETLDRVFDLSPEHLSFYSLQVEEGTPFYELQRFGSGCQTTDEENRAMYQTVRKQLEKNGYEQYEISNGAKPGFQCRHNLKYWNMEDYLGLGLGAHSYIKGLRFYNTGDLEHYLSNPPEPEAVHVNTREEEISDYLFTGLRKRQGISAAEFQNRFGEALEKRYGRQIKEFTQKGLLSFEKGRLAFTVEGLDFTNTVIRELL